ncbi:MAG: hypothetical protein [Chaetfec virus UA24_244]|nr:MAG: hypothetical protein [Chaetfec virus UA24_244]
MLNRPQTPKPPASQTRSRGLSYALLSHSQSLGAVL